MRYNPFVRFPRWMIGLVAAVLFVIVVAGLATQKLVGKSRRANPTSEVQKPSDPSTWPNIQASLQAPEIIIPNEFNRFKVFVDPGHGAKGNTGNLSSYCEDEQDFTLALGEELSAYLVGTEHFDVESSRRGQALVPYPDRVKRAVAWGAHVFISLHSDVRGSRMTWSPDGERQCPRSEGAEGFSILFSDEGALANRRKNLAGCMARRMAQAGFTPYDGAEYQEYEADDVPGVFVDRHKPGKRIFVLRKPSMPSVIIETHNAWDAGEASRWKEPKTRDVFFATIVASLIDFFQHESK